MILFIGWDIQKDDPESSGGAILINLNEDIIYVGYETNDVIERFSEAEDLTEHPNRLQLWLNRRDNIKPAATNAEPDSTDVEQ